MRDTELNAARCAPSNGRASLLDPFWKLLDNTLAAVQNRLELFRVEAQEEKIRLMEMLLLAAIAIVLGILAISVATFAIVLVVWQRGVLLLLPCVIGAYAAGAYFAWRGLQARLKGEAPFAATADEIRKDRECIKSAL